MTAPSFNTTVRGLVTMDDMPAFVADIVCDPEGHPLRWNGFIAAPLFDRGEAQRLVQELEKDNFPTAIELDRWVWEGDTLLQFEWDGKPLDDSDTIGYRCRRIRPDAQGRYLIGAYAWTWYLADR